MTFLVHFASSQRRFEANPGESLLAAGLRNGLALPHGCRSGRCGSCRARLVSGDVADVAEPPTDGSALTPAERAAGYVLMCQTAARSDIELRLHQPTGIEGRLPQTLTGRVASHRDLSEDVVELTLQLPRGVPFTFQPGQYVDFLPDEGGRRSFSIAVARAQDSRLVFHLRVAPGGRFARFVREQMPERALLRFEGPLGAFYLREDLEVPSILVAGGTGFAPIKAMIEGALAENPGPMHLYWGARTRPDLYLHELAQSWSIRVPGFRYTPVLSEPDDGWPGVRGLVHEAVAHDYPRLSGHAVYLAGPPAMVHAGRRAFLDAGLDPDHLFYDAFDYAWETWPSPSREGG